MRHSLLPEGVSVAHLALGDIEAVTFIAILIPLVHLFMIRSVLRRADDCNVIRRLAYHLHAKVDDYGQL